jgi:hypothetical protein
MPDIDWEHGAEYEYSEEDSVTPANENEDGEEACQHQPRMMHAALDSEFLYEVLFSE